MINMDRKSVFLILIFVLLISIVVSAVFIFPEWCGYFLVGVLFSLLLVMAFVSLSAAKRKIEVIPAVIVILFVITPTVFISSFLGLFHDARIEVILFWSGIFCGVLILLRIVQLNEAAQHKPITCQ